MVFCENPPANCRNQKKRSTGRLGTRRVVNGVQLGHPENLDVEPWIASGDSRAIDSTAHPRWTGSRDIGSHLRRAGNGCCATGLRPWQRSSPVRISAASTCRFKRCGCGCRGPASCEAGPSHGFDFLQALLHPGVLSRFAPTGKSEPAPPRPIRSPPTALAPSVSITPEQKENLLQQPSPIKRFAWSEKTWPTSLQPKMPTTAPPCPIGAAEILRSRHARILTDCEDSERFYRSRNSLHCGDNWLFVRFHSTSQRRSEASSIS